MKPISSVSGHIMPLVRDDVDTDQIMPKQFLSRTERTGYGEFVFHEWRREQDFVFNAPQFAGAKILVTGGNFGSGSSREHAVWGLQQYGFEVIIAPSFSDIFIGNCIQNGLLPARTDPETCRQLQDLAQDTPDVEVTVDLQTREIRWLSKVSTFQIDPRSRESLLYGLDDITLTFQEIDSVSAYEGERPAWTPSVNRKAGQ